MQFHSRTHLIPSNFSFDSFDELPLHFCKYLSGKFGLSLVYHDWPQTESFHPPPPFIIFFSWLRCFLPPMFVFPSPNPPSLSFSFSYLSHRILITFCLTKIQSPYPYSRIVTTYQPHSPSSSLVEYIRHVFLSIKKKKNRGGVRSICERRSSHVSRRRRNSNPAVLLPRCTCERTRWGIKRGSGYNGGTRERLKRRNACPLRHEEASPRVRRVRLN